MSNPRDPVLNTYGWKVIGTPSGTVIVGMKDIGVDHPMKELGGSARIMRDISFTMAIGKEIVGGSSTGTSGIVTVIAIITGIVTIVIETVTK